MEIKSANDEQANDLNNLVDSIKFKNRGKQYDCLIGVSGGVDSAYVLHKAIQIGLRPLVIHVDNGWNTALSQHNVEKLVVRSNSTFLSEILYWPEYRDHLKALLRSNVVDLELLADNIMNKVLLRTAIKYNIKHILNGVNTTTEGIALPKNWAWNKLDGTNLTSIIKRYSESNIDKIKPIGPSAFYSLQKFYGVKNIPFLNYFDFNKEKALIELKERFDFVPYRYKHYESVFTRFYQGYILPNKFGIDKRKMHFSALIVSGEMSREKACELLNTSPYPSQSLLLRDKKFVSKKLGLDNSALDEYISQPEVPHDTYKTNVKNLQFAKRLFKLEVGFNR